MHSLQDNLSLSPVLIFQKKKKKKLRIKLFQIGEMWRICLQAYNQQHMNSMVRIKLHMLTSCLIHEDLKFGPWYKVSTWMTLWAIIKIPWNKGFSKVLIVCSPGMCSSTLRGHWLGWTDYSWCLTTAKCGDETQSFLWSNWCFSPVSVDVGQLFFLHHKKEKK